MSTYTASLRFVIQTQGDPAVANLWGNNVNATFQAIESAITGNGGIAIGGLTTYTLTVADNAPDQSRQAVYNFTGALAANCTVTMPSVAKVGWVTNATTGGFSVILTTGAGTTLTVAAGFTSFYSCDGVNVATVSLGVAGFSSASAIALTGGTINGMAIGGTTPAAGTFTSVTVSSPGTFSGFGIVPVGGQIPFGGATVPAGWLLCDGQAVSRTAKAALFAAIGTAYGAGDGVTTFNVPDKRGRTSIGLDNMGGTAANRVTVAGSGVQSTTLGGTGGDQLQQTHLHTASVTDPGHTHTDAGHTHGLPVNLNSIDNTAPSAGPLASNIGGAAFNATNAGNAAIQTSSTGVTVTVANAGGGAAQNMPPVQAENWIIYAAA